MSSLTDSLSALTQLATDVFKKCRACVGNYKNLAPDARKISNGLEDLEDAIQSHRISASDGEALRSIMKECYQLLEELAIMLNQYNALELPARTAWDEMETGRGKEKEMRLRLNTMARILVARYEELMDPSKIRVQEALDQLRRDIQSGSKDPTWLVALSTATQTEDQDSVWPEVVKDLEILGIPDSMANQHRSFVIEWSVHALNKGLLVPMEDGMGMSALTLTDSSPGLEVARSRSNSTIPRKPVGLPDQTPLIPVASLSPQTTPMQTPRLPSTPSMPQLQYRNSRNDLSFQYPSPQIPPQPMHYPSQSQNWPTQVAPISYQYALPLQVPPQQLQPTVSDQSSRRHSFISTSQSPIKQDDTNLIWTAQRIVRFWNNREWRKAAECLEHQLNAVLAGETITLMDAPSQPDIRVLQHLLGCCASFQGDFVQAKKWFLTVQQTPFTGGVNLDDGDIAAAVWLGDTCLFLDEPINAALAWCVALDGLTAKHGFDKVSKSRFMVDISILDRHTKGLAILRDNFNRLNTDASTIYSTTSNAAKNSLVNVTLQRLRHSPGTYDNPFRLGLNMQLAEGFLVQQLVSTTAWPLQYDPYFRTEPTIMFIRDFKTRGQYAARTISAVGLGSSKSLDYTTKHKQEAQWLIDTIRDALKFYELEFREFTTKFLIRINNDVNMIQSPEAYSLEVRKLPLRSHYGFKISDPVYLTRGYSVSLAADVTPKQMKHELAQRIKEFCEQCERALTGEGVRPEHPNIPEVEDTPLAEMPADRDATYAKNHVELDPSAVMVELPGSFPTHGYRR